EGQRPPILRRQAQKQRVHWILCSNHRDTEAQRRQKETASKSHTQTTLLNSYLLFLSSLCLCVSVVSSCFRREPGTPLRGSAFETFHYPRRRKKHAPQARCPCGARARADSGSAYAAPPAPPGPHAPCPSWPRPWRRPYPHPFRRAPPASSSPARRRLHGRG